MKRVILFLAIMACSVQADAMDFSIYSEYPKATVKNSLRDSAIELLAYDWHQTRTNAAADWRYQGVPTIERNKLLGPAPSAGEVDAYFAGCVAAVLLADEYLHPYVSMVIHTAVTYVQYTTVTRNREIASRVGKDYYQDPPMIRLSFKF